MLKKELRKLVLPHFEWAAESEAQAKARIDAESQQHEAVLTAVTGNNVPQGSAPATGEVKCAGEGTVTEPVPCHHPENAALTAHATNPHSSAATETSGVSNTLQELFAIGKDF